MLHFILYFGDGSILRMCTPPDLNDAGPAHNRIYRCAVPEKPGSACPARCILVWPARHRRNSPVVCDKAYLPVATAPTVVSWYRKSHLHAVRSAKKVTFGYGVGEKPYTFSPFMSAVNAALSKKMEMPVSLPLCMVKNSGTSNIAVAPAGVFTK